MEIVARDDKNDNVKEVASLEYPTTAAKKIGAGDDTKDNEKEVPCLKDPTTAAIEICAGDDTIVALDDKNDNVNDEKEHPYDMGDGDHVSTPDSIDKGIAEEKYEENETKDDGRETKNPVHTPLHHDIQIGRAS